MTTPTKATKQKLLACEEVDISELTIDSKNLRKHPERNLRAIKASLTEFGQQLPILVSADNIVLAGNGRLVAAKELGWTTIKIVRSTLKGKAATAYSVADNRTAELAGWDLDGLDLLMKEDAFTPDELEAMGFTAGDLVTLLGPENYATEPIPEEGVNLKYSEKLVIKITDLPARAKIKEAVVAMIDNNGWNSVASIS